MKFGRIAVICSDSVTRFRSRNGVERVATNDTSLRAIRQILPLYPSEACARDSRFGVFAISLPGYW